MYYFHSNTVSSLLGFLKIVDVYFILYMLLHIYVLLKWKREPRKKVIPQPGSPNHSPHPELIVASLFLFLLTRGQRNKCPIAVARTLSLISKLTKSYGACHLILEGSSLYF